MRRTSLSRSAKSTCSIEHKRAVTQDKKDCESARKKTGRMVVVRKLSEGDPRAQRHNARFGLAESEGHELLGLAEVAAAEVAVYGVEVWVIGKVLRLTADI